MMLIVAAAAENETIQIGTSTSSDPERSVTRPHHLAGQTLILTSSTKQFRCFPAKCFKNFTLKGG